MTRIGLLSDTHHFLDERIFLYFSDCDEIWHAGDFGTIAVAERLAAFKPLKGVFGNIDGMDLRSIYPQVLSWTCEEVKVLMTHIGGSPGRYPAVVKDQIKRDQPDLFVCGHSHILKIMYDPQYSCLYLNPGAAGKQGWHTVRTLVRFMIDGKNISNCEVIELGKRGSQTGR